MGGFLLPFLFAALSVTGVPKLVGKVLDRAIQLHGAGGLSEDFFLAEAFVGSRSLRFADGPDEVHLGVVGKHEVATQLRLHAKL